MVKGKRFILVLLGVFLFVSLLSSAVLGFGYLLRYRFQEDEVLLYQDTVKVDATIKEDRDTMRNIVSVIVDYRQKMLEVKNNQYSFEITFDKLDIPEAILEVSAGGREPRAMDMKSRTMSTYKALLDDNWLRITIDNRGNILEEDISKDIKEQLQGDILQVGQRLFLPMPADVLDKGSSWEEELIFEVPEIGKDIKITVTNKVKDVKMVEGRECLIIETTISDSFEIEMEEGQKARFSIEGSRVLSFSHREGRVIAAEEDQWFSLELMEGDKMLSSAEATIISETIFLGKE